MSAPTLHPIPDANAIDLKDVTFRRNDRDIIPGASFTVGRGEHWVMLGANGAGKSTLLSFCGAMAHPTSGTVDILGHRLGRVELRALRRLIGHVNPRHPLQGSLRAVDVVLTGLTASIERAMRFEPTAGQLAQAHELLETFGLGHKADYRWPTLSQGERGRVLIARSLITEPELLLLDEPSTGLDIAAREQLLDTQELLPQTHPGLTTVLVTHHLEEIPSNVTHALLVREGEITASGPVERVVTTMNISAAFEHPIEVSYRDGRFGARSHRESSRLSLA